MKNGCFWLSTSTQFILSLVIERRRNVAEILSASVDGCPFENEKWKNENGKWLSVDGCPFENGKWKMENG
jgi:hypothetical protein